MAAHLPQTLPTLLLLLLLLTTAAQPSAAADNEREALLSFKAAVTADPGGLLRAWTPTSPSHCRWPGITCSPSGSIISLTLPASPGHRLSGTLSPSLATLRNLHTLALPSHALAGALPPAIWTLRRLQTLDLSGNHLHGEIPASLPCAALRTLDLAHNALNGSLPAALGALPALRRLSLASNRLGGAIPDALGALPALRLLDLSGNLLVGGIPRSLANCTNLQSLLLSSNLLDDVIPPEIGRLTNLRALDVSRNSLSGPIPPELGDCGQLSVLVLSNPYVLADGLNASDDGDVEDFNYFQGGIPAPIAALPKLRVLWAPRATLEGELPANWTSCQSLEMVNLGENLLSGGIPRGLLDCGHLKFLNLSSNKFTGSVDPSLPVPCMDVFDVSGNRLSGSIPAFLSRGCPSPRLLPFDDLVSEYTSFFAYQAIAGFVSSSGVMATDLTSYHSFARNNFTGTVASLPIAAEKLGMQGAYAFLADGNDLAGELQPGLFDKCSNSSRGFIVDVSNNLITGGIPAEIGLLCRSLVVLGVAGNRLSGFIPASIGQLDYLIRLDLSRNQLGGEIPASVKKLPHLELLSLSHNLLNGTIPDDINQLHSLKVLDLSSNLLAGEIPRALADLANLTDLFLDNNKLTGEIPAELANVPSLTKFNVSFNNLSGPVPTNSSAVGCDSVIGNPLLQSCHMYTLMVPSAGQQGRGLNSNDNDTAPVDQQNQGDSSSFNAIEIASITSATAIVAVLLALIVLFIYTRKCVPCMSARSSGRREVIIFQEIGVPITYETVVRATGTFNASNCIGSGGFGATYKAEISPGVLVAIKRLSVGRFQGAQQFHAEIKTLGRLRHPNLVTLIGYHLGESEMFLIYNYLPGGNLERFIQERSKRPVGWKRLHKIALDIAKALAYLHDTCVPRILHRDVKPNNILLDTNHNAYLSDFGLARLLGNSETHATTGVAGTFGYVAPEYAMTCRVSDKADVYSYGVVLMELISDKKALDPSFSPYGNGFNIVAWACMLLRQGRGREFFVDGLWDVGPHDDLIEVLHLAVMCTVESLSVRPTMKQVVQRLKQLQPPIREHR